MDAANSKLAASMHDIVDFIEKYVKIASDPLFGNFSDYPSVLRKEVKSLKYKTGFKAKEGSLATIV